jgi:hypothetical protein
LLCNSLSNIVCVEDWQVLSSVSNVYEVNKISSKMTGCCGGRCLINCILDSFYVTRLFIYLICYIPIFAVYLFSLFIILSSLLCSIALKALNEYLRIFLRQHLLLYFFFSMLSPL